MAKQSKKSVSGASAAVVDASLVQTTGEQIASAVATQPTVTAGAGEQAAKPVAIVTVRAETKADKARVIFNESYATNPVPARKHIIDRMVAEAGLTKMGAATYLQNMKKKAGLVVSRTSGESATA